jgi:AGCS family alanine or glycine:cation symporter
MHITSIPAVFASIIEGAFTPKGATGGAVGSMIVVLTWGVKRGIFSNEAGLGSAPMAHANSSETNPVKQGMYGIFEVFMITIILCTITGLTLLTSGIDMNYGVNGDTGMNAAALATVFGTKGGAIIIGICIILFAFSTIPGWTMYGVRCCEYLFGIKAIKPYQVLSIVVSFVGCTMSLDLAWAIADTLNGLMAIPNLIAVIALSGVVVRTTKEYFGSLPSKKASIASKETAENEG